MQVWTADRAKDWPPTFSRQWLWTMGAERSGHDRVISTSQAIGATDVIPLINNSPTHQPVFGMNPNRALVVELSKRVRDVGLDFHIGSWLDPSKVYVDQAASELASLVDATKAKSVCLDAEGEWRLRIKNHIQFVAEVVNPAFAGFPVPIGITSFASLPKEAVPLLLWAVEYHDGYGMPQPYSVWQNKEWQKAGSVQADKITALAWRTWSKFTPKLVPLLNAFGPVHPGRAFKDGAWTGAPWTVAEALETNLLRAEYDGFKEFGLWSEEALRSTGTTAKVRREVLSEVIITGDSTVLDTSSPYVPLLAAGGVLGATYLTRKFWLPGLSKAWRMMRGG